MPPPIGPSSSTMTDLPARASRYAVVNPAMPAPTMHTFALVSLLSGSSCGVAPVAIHTEVVVPEVGCIVSSKTAGMMAELGEKHAANEVEPLLSETRMRVLNSNKRRKQTRRLIQLLVGLMGLTIARVLFKPLARLRVRCPCPETIRGRKRRGEQKILGREPASGRKRLR